MPYDVRWSEDALTDFKEILVYINEQWCSNSVLKFQSKVEKEIEIISEMP